MHRIAKLIFFLNPLADLNKLVLTNSTFSLTTKKNMTTLKCNLKAVPELYGNKIPSYSNVDTGTLD